MGNRLVIILIILLLLLSGGIYYLYNEVGNLETELVVKQQNNTALRDSVRVSKNKLDDLEYSKSILVLEKKDLETNNKGLYHELKKEKGRVSALASTNIKLKGKVAELESGVEYIPPTGTDADSTYRINWGIHRKFDEFNSRKISGYSTFKLDKTTYLLSDVSSHLLVDEVNFKIVQGLREVDGVVELFARSNYGGFGVTEVNSVIIDPNTNPILSKFTKKKTTRVGLSLYTGYGLTYNFKTQETLDGYQIGGGIYWRPDLSKLFK
jgi:cell division protein FtsB